MQILLVSEEIDTKYLKLSNKDLFKNQNLSFNKVSKKLKIDKSSSNEVEISEYKKKISGAFDLFSYSISEYTIEEIRKF